MFKQKSQDMPIFDFCDQISFGALIQTAFKIGIFFDDDCN